MYTYIHTRCIIITQGQYRVRCDLSGYLWCSLRESSRIRSEIVAEGWINTTPHAQTYAIMKTKRRSCYNMMDRGATFHSTDRPSPSITSTTGEVEKAIKAWRVLASNPLQTLQTLETYCVRFNFHGVKLLQFAIQQPSAKVELCTCASHSRISLASSKHLNICWICTTIIQNQILAFFPTLV